MNRSVALHSINLVKQDDSNNHFRYPSRIGFAVRRLDDSRLRWLGAGRRTHIQGAPVRSVSQVSSLVRRQ